jgi:hypothetical protein
MSISVNKSSFTGGEWSPSLYSRTDLAKYGTANRTMRNFYPHPHGGASNRAGFEFIHETKTSSKTSRLVPFQFSVAQGYFIEFGNLYVRFYKDDGVIVSAKTITAASNATPIVVTSVAHGFANGNTVTVSGVLGNTAANGTWIIANKTNDTFELVGSVGNAAYTSGGTATAIVEVVTPYLEADLPLLKFEQSADILYIAHPSYAPAKLSRSSHTAWTYTTITFGASIAAPTGLSMSGTGRFYVVTAISEGVESVPSAEEEGAAAQTLSWSSVSGATEYNVYERKNGVYLFVGRAGSTSFDVPATYELDGDSSPPEAQNPLGSSNNYPGCVAFNDQRLLFARTNTQPQTFWGSVVGDFENLNTSSPIQDDDSFEFTINSGQVNEIRWMAALTDLIIGTSGSEWKLTAGGNSDAITPTSAKLVRQSRWGVAHTQPIIIGDSILFVDGSSQKVRDLYYALARDGYEGSDLTILAQHLFEVETITEWAYAQHPDSIIWAVRSDGVLCGLTYQKEHQVFGWHHHDTQGTFESVATIKEADGTFSTYVIVKRTINSQTKRYVEKLHLRDFTDIEGAFFVDAGLTYDGSVSASLTPGAGANVSGSNAVTFTAGSAIFAAGDAATNREIHYRFIDEDGIYQSAKARIVGFTSTTVVTADIMIPFPSLAVIASGDWRLSVDTLTGLSHLEGMDVVMLADGNVIADKTVASGSVTLDNPASIIHVGLGYTCDLETLGFDFPTQAGTMQDKIRYIESIIIRLANTRACNVGPDEDHLDALAFRDQEDLGEATGLFSGDREVSLDPGDPREGRTFVRVLDTEPLPCTVQAIIARMKAGEK